MVKTQSDQLDKIFSALANPVRRDILEKLMEKGSMNVGDLSQPLAISAPAISRHLKVLEETGLIRHEKQTQFRIYSFNIDAFNETLKYLEQYRKYWNQQFDRLDQQLKTRKRKDGA
jgi:DNA-binding transcriptional ArsR family regulator